MYMTCWVQLMYYFSDLINVHCVKLLTCRMSFQLGNLSGWWKNQNHSFSTTTKKVHRIIKFEQWNIIKKCSNICPLIKKKKISHFTAIIKIKPIFMQIVEYRWNDFFVFWTLLALRLVLQLGKHLRVLWSKQEPAVVSFDDIHIKLLVNLNYF